MNIMDPSKKMKIKLMMSQVIVITMMISLKKTIRKK